MDDSQLTMFDLVSAEVMLPHRIASMRRIHGADDAHRCGTCAHLVRVTSTGRQMYSKCDQYGISASDATDWRQKWPACGLWSQAGD